MGKRPISLGNRNVALEPLKFGPADGTLAKLLGECCFIQSGKVVQARGQSGWRGKKGLFGRPFSSEVEGADVQAVVTPEDVIPHPRGQFLRNVLA